MFQALILSAGWAVALLQCVALWRLRQLLQLFHVRTLISTPSMLEDLPSVSVCIPARNERHAMTRCLEAVLQSRYKKLEILVLDDASVDNTSQLIRAFAKDGVRFIQGGAPPTGWLGKNYALQRLASEASGTYIVFLDVDTILAPTSVSQLVSYAETTRASMTSVLPVRRDLWRLSVMLAPLRYFWAILFYSKHRPVAASSIWMVRRKQLLADFNTFETLRVDIEPEVTIAEKYLSSDSYRFLTSQQLLGVSVEKKMSSQLETVRRLRFPQLDHSVVRTCVAVIAMSLIACAPFLVAILPGGSILLGALLYVLGTGVYYQYLRFTWSRGALIGAWFWPLPLLLDAYSALSSMIGYKTHTITWKGRPIVTSQE